MRNLIKNFARWILNEELEYSKDRIERLQKFCEPHLPQILADGSDQASNTQIHLEVLSKAFLPVGKTTSNSPIIMHGEDYLVGTRRDFTKIITGKLTVRKEISIVGLIVRISAVAAFGFTLAAFLGASGW